MSAMAGHGVEDDVPGVVAFVTKPFDIEPFLELVAKAVANGQRSATPM